MGSLHSLGGYSLHCTIMHWSSNTQHMLDMHFATTTVTWMELSLSSVLPIFHFSPLLSFLLSLLLWIIPFPTHLGSLCSLRWCPVNHTFPPAMAAHVSLPLGALAPLTRDSALGINPIIISYSVTPGHPWVAEPTLCRSIFWGEEYGPETTPSELCPSDKALSIACLCVCVCSSDL